MARAAATLCISIGSDGVISWAQIPWSRCIPWVRAALAGAALGLSFIYVPDLPLSLRGLLALFTGVALLLAARGKGLTGMLGLLGLFADTVYFLVLASI